MITAANLPLTAVEVSANVSFVEHPHHEKYSGYVTRYFENSREKKSEGKLRNGVMYDTWIYYFVNGSVMCEAEYDEGVLVKIRKSFYDTGEKESLLDEENGLALSWHRNGSLRSIVHFGNDNLQEPSSSKYWYENGQLKSEYKYYNHHNHGVLKEFYSNRKGQVALVSVYCNGELSGYWQAFYPDGRLKYKGWYSKNRKTGEWISRNDEGQIVKEVF